MPLRDQDRSRWDSDLIAEGVALLEEVLPRGHVGRYQLQAAIAAVHAEAPTWADTDWVQIALLYAMLHDLAPGPAVTLNRAVATAMATRPTAGLALIDQLLADPAMRGTTAPTPYVPTCWRWPVTTPAALPSYQGGGPAQASRPSSAT